MRDRFDEMAEQCVAKFSYMLPDSKAARDGAKAAVLETLRAVAEEPWRPIAEAPVGLWLRTRREGEDGENIRMARRMHPDEEIEWIEHGKYGRTTITHHSFAAPTHWLCPAPPRAEG